ncbi:MAG: metal ABC transporter ATP-binding protein [Campylobacteraceae bacterium]
MAILEVKNLNFAYEKQNVLENINFEYEKEDFLAIIGPNGGGKSTLLKLIIGLLPIQSGEIKLFSHNPQDETKKIGYVPQDTQINKDFPISVLDVVLMGKLSNKGFGFYNKEDKKQANEMLERVSMLPFANKKIGELSGGQRQRVFIARALATNAKLLVLDEPTASIDMQGGIQIFDLLKSLNKEKGVIVVSHDINITLGYATKIAYINKTLFMHEASSVTKDAFFNTLRQSSDHLCPVEILTANTCTHNTTKWKTHR